MESVLSEAQKEHVKSLDTRTLKARIEFHKRVVTSIVSGENERWGWALKYHKNMLEYTEEIYAERILLGDEN